MPGCRLRTLPHPAAPSHVSVLMTMLFGMGLVALSVVVMLPVTQSAGAFVREDLAFALSVLLLGFLMMVTRRNAVSQVIGFMSLENGLVLAASGARGMPLVVEISVGFSILIRFVASPRHADLLLVTGPVTLNMREALERTYAATPAPKWVVAVGDCGAGCGVFAGSYACVGAVSIVIPVDLVIRGCPPTPTDLLQGLLGLLSGGAGVGVDAKQS
jgi:hypothetical protein